MTGDHTLDDIAGIAGCGRMTVHRCLVRLAEGGWDLLLRRDKPGARKSPMQAPQVQEEFQAKLRAGDFRTARQARRWLQERFGIELKVSSIYFWLNKYRASLKVPRPVHLKKKPLAAEIFPFELEAELWTLNLKPGRPVRIWMQDEGRFGLHTIVRRCWGLPGVRVVKTNQKKYQWGYLYGALEIGTGKTEALFMPNVGLEVSEVFLRHLADSEPEAEHIVIWDGAGFHQKADKHAVPDRVHVIQLPAYCPELNPVEKLWDVIKDGICNRIFHTLEELWAAVCEELKPFYQPERVHQLLGESELLSSANASSNAISTIN